ncbi:hypothetical protein GCM10017690_01150 [Microbacterium terregens]
MKGETIMRPWRTGTRSGTREVACSSSSDTGSARSAGGDQTAWLVRGVRMRAALPKARRPSKSDGAGGVIVVD